MEEIDLPIDFDKKENGSPNKKVDGLLETIIHG